MPLQSFLADGTIQPSTFVILDDGGENAVVAASGASTPLLGISQESAGYAPIPGATGQAASAGDSVLVYTGTEGPVLLSATSAGWTAGDLLTSNSAGLGIAASGSDYVGAQALTTLSGAGLGRVQITKYMI